jgi:hypothetical protein
MHYARRAAGIGLLAMLLLAGCKKDAPAPAGSAKGEAKAPATPAVAVKAGLKADNSLGDFPEDVIAVASFESLDSLKGFVTTIAKAASDEPVDFEKEFFDDLLANTGIQSVDFAESTKPVYIAVFNPKAEGEAVALVPIKAKEAFNKALGDKLSPKAEGGGFLIKGEMEEMHGDFFEGYVALAEKASDLTKGKDFLVKVTKTLKPKAPIHVVVSLKNVNRIFGPELEKAKGEILKEMYGQLAGMPGAVDPAMLQKMYGTYLDQAMEALKSTTLGDMRFALKDGSLQFDGVAEVAKDSKLARFLAKPRGKALDLAQRLPSSTYMVFAGHIPPDLVTSWQNQSIDFLGGVLQFTPEEKTELTKIIGDYMETNTGDSAMSLHVGGGTFPLSTVAIVGVKDAAKAKASMGAYANFMLKKVGALAKPFMGQQGAPQLDFSSWKSLFAGLNALTGAMGLALELVEEGEVTGLKMKMNYEAAPALPPPVKEMIKKIVGEGLQVAFAFGKGVAVTAFGNVAFADAKAALDGKKSFDDGAFKKNIAAGAANPMVVTWLDLGRVLSKVSPLVDSVGAQMGGDPEQVKAISTKLAAYPAGMPFTMTVGGDASALHGNFNFPLEAITALKNLAE